MKITENYINYGEIDAKLQNRIYQLFDRYGISGQIKIVREKKRFFDDHNFDTEYFFVVVDRHGHRQYATVISRKTPKGRVSWVYYINFKNHGVLPAFDRRYM